MKQYPNRLGFYLNGYKKRRTVPPAIFINSETRGQMAALPRQPNGRLVEVRGSLARGGARVGQSPNINAVRA